MPSYKPPVYKRVSRWNIHGDAHFLTFSCYRRLPLLMHDHWCVFLAAAVKGACAKLDVRLWAYVFMPDHVHLLIKPCLESYRTSNFLRAVKQPVATKVLNGLKRKSSTFLGELRANDKPEGTTHRFWQAGGGYDFNVWSTKKAIEKAQYCHRNPVVRGLADNRRAGGGPAIAGSKWG